MRGAQESQRIYSRVAVCLRLALFGAVIVTGCGTAATSSKGGSQTDGGIGPVSTAPIAVADLCPVFTSDLCTYLIQCGQAPYRNLAQCLAEVDCYGLAQLQAAVAAGGVVYDPSKVGACHARFLSDPCNFAFFLFTPTIFDVLSYCPGTITPELAAGADCVADGECTQGLYCQKTTSGACPGKCTAYAEAGAACGLDATLMTYPQCGPELECNNNNICQPNGKPGSVCANDSDCGPTIICLDDPSCVTPNLWCNLSGGGATGTCNVGVAAGATCGAAKAGTTSYDIQCADGLWCSQIFIDQAGVCRVPAGMGAPCNNFGGCEKGFHCGGYVPVGAGATLGQCVPPSASGGPCTFTDDCQPGLGCPASTCAPLGALGGLCQQDGDCQAGMTCASGKCAHAAYPGDACVGTTSVCVLSLCKNGTCVDTAKVGQPCMVDADCGSGTCLQGTCADTSVCAVP